MGVVGLFFDFLMFLLMNHNELFAFANMIFKILADCNTQVFGSIGSVEFLIVESGWKNQWISFPSYTRHLTLVWVEFHGPVPLPLVEGMEIILEGLGIR